MIKLTKRLLEGKNLLIVGVLYSILITIAFLGPTSTLPKIDFVFPFDKVVHLIIYLFLAIIWLFYFFKKNNNHLNFRTILVVMLVFLVYGTVIEVLQELFTASRQADIYDVLANTIGSLIGVFVFLNVKNRIKT